MSIVLNWFDEEKTIILCSFEGHWTWQEYSLLEKRVWHYIGQRDYRIDVLADWTLSAGFPLGLMDIIRRVGESRHPPRKDIWVINISTMPLIEILTGIFRRTYPKVASNYYTAKTLEEAIHMLQSSRGYPIVRSISPFKQSD